MLDPEGQKLEGLNLENPLMTDRSAMGQWMSDRPQLHQHCIERWSISR
jgi:hypothetical protein